MWIYKTESAIISSLFPVPVNRFRTASSNIASQRVAHRVRFKLVWVCAFRGQFNGILTGPAE
jgi:hypothetical protein